jgi:hypothetical protein
MTVALPGKELYPAVDDPPVHIMLLTSSRSNA